MARLAGSFLIRLWRTNRSQRIEIEHIQSGEKGLVTSLVDAVDWISVRTDDETDDERGAAESPASHEVDRRCPWSGM